jgi:hypothetical protein
VAHRAGRCRRRLLLLRHVQVAGVGDGAVACAIHLRDVGLAQLLLLLLLLELLLLGLRQGLLLLLLGLLDLMRLELGLGLLRIGRVAVARRVAWRCKGLRACGLLELVAGCCPVGPCRRCRGIAVVRTCSACSTLPLSPARACRGP